MRKIFTIISLLVLLSSLVYAEKHGSRTIYLVRHGFYDHKDTNNADIGKGLTPFGRNQAEIVAGRLYSLSANINSIVTSTMKRAQQTAEIIHNTLPDVTLEQSDLIRECTPPTWRADIMAKESLANTELCSEQIDKALKKYFIPSDSEDDKVDILVCHGNVIRALVVKALGVDPESWLNMSISNCSITAVKVDGDGTTKLLSFNDTGHLPANMITTTGTKYDAKMLYIPEYFTVDDNLSLELNKIVKELGLDKNFDVGEDGIEQISIAVIDLSHGIPHIGGAQMENFIYPASVYKMYVAAEVLNQIYHGKHLLYEQYIVKSPNDVDQSKEIKSDPRPLLRDGDTVTVNYLLDLMISRSDNSAANCLIDIAGRENIKELMHKYNWYGSEVTRKFLSRKYEDPGYEEIKGTETCALHAADFMYKVYTNTLVNPWVSMQMKSLLSRQLDKSKLAQGLPPDAMYYHKTGWYAYWTNDVGIVDDGEHQYIISCFLPLPEKQAQPKMKELSRRVYELITSRK